MSTRFSSYLNLHSSEQRPHLWDTSFTFQRHKGWPDDMNDNAGPQQAAEREAQAR